MTHSPIEFIDCNLEQMREIYAANAANVLPYCMVNKFPQTVCSRIRDGKLVLAQQETKYYNSEGYVVSRIMRLFHEDGDPLDIPLTFTVGKKAYNLTDW